MKYVKGNIIKFKIKNLNISSIFNAENEGIPKNKIIHGNCSLKKNKGIVEDIYNEYIIVSYTCTNNKKVQLGFLEKDLELINSELQYEIC